MLRVLVVGLWCVLLFLLGGVVKGLAVVLVLLVVGAAAVATHPDVLQNLAITSCPRYVLVSAHASHPQQDVFGGVTAKIGYGFTYRPWGTVERVYVLPNGSDVREVVFVINRTGLMDYFKLFKDWKPRDIALIVNINNRAIAFEFAYLYPDGTIKQFKDPKVRIIGNEVHVKVHGWRKEPCTMNVAFGPAIEFYNGVAPVNWVSLPGATAKLRCASCMVTPTKPKTTSTVTGTPAPITSLPEPTPSPVPEPRPTFTSTSTPVPEPRPVEPSPTHTVHRSTHRSVLDQIRSAIQDFIARVKEWLNNIRWPW